MSHDDDLKIENARLRARLAEAEAELQRLRSGSPAGKAVEALSGTRAELLLTLVQQERERLFSVLSMLPGYVCLLTTDHQFRFVNRSFIEQFGDPQGRPCYAALFNREKPCDNCESFRCLEAGSDIVWEWTAPTGSVFEVYDYPFMDADGTQLVLEVGFDITDRKRNEDELRRYRDDLQELVRERTAKLRETNTRFERETAQHKAAAEALAKQHELLDTFFNNSLTCTALLDRDFNFLRVNEAYAAADGRHPEDFPGRNHFDLYPSDAEDIFRQVVQSRQPYHVQARPFVYADNPERGVTYWDWSLVPVLDERGEVDYLFYCLNDVTERTRAEEERKAVIELLQVVNLAPNLEALASALVSHLRQWTGCEGAAVRIRRGETFPVLAAEGYPEELLEAENSLCAFNDTGEVVRDADGKPALECLCGCVLCHSRASDKEYLTDHGSFCVNSSREFLVDHKSDLPERIRGRCIEHGYESLAIVPLKLRDEPFGLLHLCDKRKGVFTESTLLVLEQLADNLAIALAHGAAQADLVRHEEDLRALAAQLAMTEEQQRLSLATVLHDDLCQTLGFMKMKLVALRQPEAAVPTREAATEIEGLLNEAISFTRGLTVELSPPVLQRFGLAAALKWQAERVASKHGLTVECECDEECLLSSETDTILFRSVRELLTNVVKYAQAQRVRIWMTCTDEAATIGVADDGVGFNPNEMRVGDEQGGFGLFSIRESLAHLGGRLEIDSAPGAGTVCTLTMPR
ncbi:MAG: PAS domain-containing protein [Armatimonadia bacterium]